MGLYNISMALFFVIEFIILIIGLKFNNKKMLMIFIIILFSFLYAQVIESKYEKAFFDNENFYIAKVESLKEEVKYYNRYIVRIKSGKYQNSRVLVYTNDNLSYGDIIRFSEKIEKPERARNDKRI